MGLMTKNTKFSVCQIECLTDILYRKELTTKYAQIAIKVAKTAKNATKSHKTSFLTMLMKIVYLRLQEILNGQRLIGYRLQHRSHLIGQYANHLLPIKLQEALRLVLGRVRLRKALQMRIVRREKI